jgi:enoyl-CoA hydratase/carnithine racemase
VLLLEIRGAVAWLTLNRPDALNALNSAMVDRFAELLPRLADDESIRVVVLTGNGRAFCAGADLKEVQSGSKSDNGVPDFLDRANAHMFNALRDFPKPVIAALNGITMAGGLELATGADIVLASEDCRIADAHANFGVFPGAGGAAVMPRLVPPNVAKYLLFTGDTLSAQEMKTHGFVNEVLPADRLLGRAQELAEQIAGNSPLAMRRMKAVANASPDRSRDEALAHEQEMLREHMRSEDMAEGLAAFVEKRKPEFRGR